jgi:hypothetical protein
MAENTHTSPTEQLLLSTFRLAMHSSDHEIGSGTGFLISMPVAENSHSLFLATNKHIAYECEALQVVFSAPLPNGLPDPSRKVPVTIRLSRPDGVIGHPDPSVDLCLIPVGNVLAQFKAKIGWLPLFSWVNLDHIPTQEEWEDLHAIEEVIMIGAPNGIFDSHNNLPVARRGITATPPSLNFKGRNEFLVDMACFGGSSGSPVFICNTTGFSTRRGNMSLGGIRVRLLGILWGGPFYNAAGELVVSQIPTSTTVKPVTPMMLNLGYVIRSSALHDFVPLVKELFGRPVETFQPSPQQLEANS